VREALRSLEVRGLIWKRPGARGGSFVKRQDPAAVDDDLLVLIERLMHLHHVGYGELIDIRRILEGPAVRLACQSATDEQIASMVAWVERETQTVASPSEEKVQNLHMLIAEASGNRILCSLISALHRQSARTLHLPMSRVSAMKAREQHAEIVKAIAARDADLAEYVLMQHLEALKRVMEGADEHTTHRL